MECVDSSSNYPRCVYEADSTGMEIDRAPTDKDSFYCTFFRQSKFKPSNAHSLSSDTYTDSDSEPDDPHIVQPIEKSSRKFLRASEQSVIDKNKSRSPKPCDAPRVRFCAPVCTNPAPRKRWIREGTGCGPAKLPRVIKRNTCLKKNCPEIRQHSAMSEKQGPEFARVIPEKFPEPTGDAIRNCESAIEDRIVRNKRLLKSIEEMIRTMNETKMTTESKPCIEPSNKVAKTNLIDEIIDRERGKRFRAIPNDMEQVLVHRPFFQSSKLEKHLDQSMQRAMTKYRTCWKWGEQGSLKE
ncbi:uncharacterized protein LOC143211281 [Lasioglossum baleicum]|uniref:uncharacterized protein LOC143211281 n=1 Tax=Lasioglossum baleicum TaxID=434251 RepID=UPI003FCEAC83